MPAIRRLTAPPANTTTRSRYDLPVGLVLYTRVSSRGTPRARNTSDRDIPGDHPEQCSLASEDTREFSNTTEPQTPSGEYLHASDNGSPSSCVTYAAVIPGFTLRKFASLYPGAYRV